MRTAATRATETPPQMPLQRARSVECPCSCPWAHARGVAAALCMQRGSARPACIPGCLTQCPSCAGLHSAAPVSQLRPHHSVPLRAHIGSLGVSAPTCGGTPTLQVCVAPVYVAPTVSSTLHVRVASNQRPCRATDEAQDGGQARAKGGGERAAGAGQVRMGCAWRPLLARARRLCGHGVAE